jgi:hypothetical protein
MKRREPIFLDDADRQRFVETLAGVCAKTGWLHASLDFKLQIADCRLTGRSPARHGRAPHLHLPIKRSISLTAVTRPVISARLTISILRPLQFVAVEETF